MEFTAIKKGFLLPEETQMLSTGNYGHCAFFRCSEAPTMEQSDEPDSKNIVDEIEKEHMFDKVVTPSDVGKLNRLVIPKQFAERYFPLDSSGNEKGLLLNFQDRNGNPWRFRYSYWNSSQSYVITKGWSRFVKEKRLNAGDVVSFQRGVGQSNKHRLFIDWKRRRQDHVGRNSRQEQPFVPLMNVNGGLGPNFSRVRSGGTISSYRGGHGSYGGGAVAMMKTPMEGKKRKMEGKKRKTELKSLRLFGVNMECPNSESEHECTARIQPPYLHRLHLHGSLILGNGVAEKGNSSMSFDFCKM